jgi:hypothetical protein
MQGEVEKIAHMLPKGTKDQTGLLEHLEAAILEKQKKVE